MRPIGGPRWDLPSGRAAELGPWAVAVPGGLAKVVELAFPPHLVVVVVVAGTANCYCRDLWFSPPGCSGGGKPKSLPGLDLRLPHLVVVVVGFTNRFRSELVIPPPRFGGRNYKLLPGFQPGSLKPVSVASCRLFCRNAEGQAGGCDAAVAITAIPRSSGPGRLLLPPGVWLCSGR